MEIRGHTDARPFVSPGQHQQLGPVVLSGRRRRAASSSEAAIPAGQMGSVVARGATEPYDPARPYAASNRRLSILLKNKAGAAAEPGADPEADGDAPADVAPAAATPGRRPGR
jgi:flagellar motor protein MotB